MDAHIIKAATLAAVIGSLGASYRTSNFVVTAPTSEMAEQIARAAERYRKQLAIEWIGQEMPTWSQPCPITAHVGDNLGAGGVTSFLFERGEVFGWRMSIQGSLVRVLDSVLPHEVTHTIFATHFRQPLPRWADEGSCTTVEHQSERTKQQVMLMDFLRTGRGIPFSRMFAMKEYPHDVMPLYSQGYSVACYLIAQGGRRKFLDYLSDGLKDENWTRATAEHYHFANLSTLQNSWLSWVRQGSPNIDSQNNPAPKGLDSLAQNSRRRRPAPNLIYRAQNRDTEPAARTLASASPDRSDPTTYLGAKPDTDRPLNKSKPRSNPGWHPRNKGAGGSRSEDQIELASSEPLRNPEPVEHQAVRPQPVQKSRQIILEWSRPQMTADASTARSVYSQPLGD